MKSALENLDGFEFNGKRIKLSEEAKGRQQPRSRSKSPRSKLRSQSRSRSRSRSSSANNDQTGMVEATTVTDGTWICNFCNEENEYFRYCCQTCNDAKPTDEKREMKGAIPATKSGTFSCKLKL